jgi:hypothetical protein
MPFNTCVFAAYIRFNCLKMLLKLPDSLEMFFLAIKKVPRSLNSPVFFILSSLLFIHPTFANTQDEYFDDMITLKVGRYLKQEFYEVKSDYDGGIYIAIKDFLAFSELREYSKLSIEGENIKLFMAASLFPDNKARYITKKLTNLNTIIIDDQIYLDPQGISELLPLKAVQWRAENYTLVISPDFSLPLDYRIAAQRRKRSIEEEKNSQSATPEKDFFMQEDRKLIDFGMLKLRYDINDISSYFKNGAEQNKGNVDLEYSAQLLYGDFNIRHSLYPNKNLANISLKYPYILQDKTLIIGDNYIRGSNLLGYNSNIRGLSISDNDYTVTRSGQNVTIRGRAATNAMVEIYQNGKVADYQRIEGVEYEFTLEMRSQNDAFTIKVFDRNGVLLTEEIVNVMQGNDFLSAGEWDYNFFYGQNPQAENKAWDDRTYGIAYGVNNNLSYYFDYYNTRNENTLYQYAKHKLAYRFSTLFVPLVANLSYYDSLADPSQGYIGELSSEIFSHKLFYSYERFSHLLAQDENKDRYQQVEISGNYGRSDYFFRFSNKTYQDRNESIYNIGVSYDVNKVLRIKADLGKTVQKQSEQQHNHTVKIGFDYNKGDFTYNVDANYNQRREAKWQYIARLRKRLHQQTNFAYSVEVNYNKSDHFTLGITFEYKFNDFFKIDADYDSNRAQQHKVRASYETVINMKKPFLTNHAKYPDNGYLEGRIFVDKNANGEKDIDEVPVVGVGVAIGQNKVQTDRAGSFYLSNISPYRNNKLHYDYSGIMVDPTLRANSAEVVELIPASGKKISDGLVPLSLVMGSIYLPEIAASISKKFFSYVEIVVEKNGNYYSSVTPEYDGFFVLQDLKPGKYNLKINYLGSEKITLAKNVLSINVLPGDTGDFYEGIDFKVTAIEAKK